MIAIGGGIGGRCRNEEGKKRSKILTSEDRFDGLIRVIGVFACVAVVVVLCYMLYVVAVLPRWRWAVGAQRKKFDGGGALFEPESPHRNDSTAQIRLPP